jgi:hypothetical protein
MAGGVFEYQKSRFGYFMQGLGIEIVSMYFRAIWYIVWSIGTIQKNAIRWFCETNRPNETSPILSIKYPQICATYACTAVIFRTNITKRRKLALEPIRRS